MKKLAITLAIVLGMGMTTFADPNGGGLMQRGATNEEYSGNRDANSSLMLPQGHGLNNDQNAAPIGSGILVLLGMGGAYLVAKKRKEE